MPRGDGSRGNTEFMARIGRLGGAAGHTLRADWMVAERYAALEGEEKSAREIAEILHVSERTIVRWRATNRRGPR